MKIGSLEIRLAKPEVVLKEQVRLEESIRPRRPALDERGGTGDVVLGGLLTSQDYNADLVTPEAYTIYDKMRLSDGQVRAALTAIKRPLLGATWTVEPASDSAQDKKIAEFIDTGLHTMSLSWHDFLRQALLYLDYGSMPFEKVWEIKDGLVHLRKLAPRMPKTIIQWKIDETGGLAGIQQGAFTSAGYSIIDIEVEKLLVFVNEQEGSNYKGVSILRAAYKDWYLVDKLVRVNAVAKEKRGLGLDVGTLSAGADDTDKAAAEAALMSLHAHEKMYLTEIVDKFTYRIEGIGGAGGGVVDALPSIEYHDRRILRSMLVEFLGMGADASGSLAMHRDKSALFLMGLEGIAQNLINTINAYLIRQWVDYNWVVEAYPKLTHSPLDTRNVQLLAEAVEKFVAAGLLTPDGKIEDIVRDVLSFPAKPEETEVEKTPQGKQALSLSKTMRHSLIAIARPRPAVDFKTMETELDKAEREIVSAVRGVQGRQVAKLIELGHKSFLKGDMALLDDVVVPYKAEMSVPITAILKRLYEVGRREIIKELRAQGLKIELEQLPLPLDSEDEAMVGRFLFGRARALSSILGDRLKSALIWEMMAQFRLGEWSEETLREKLEALSDREIRKVAGFSVSEALNLGRQGEAERLKKYVRIAEYSAIMDLNTCRPCQSQDGRELELGSMDYELVRPPYRNCEGGGRCRCIFVYILKVEQPARV